MGVQYEYSSVGNQYNAMVYVKRRNTFHLDSSPDLFGEFKTCQSSQCSQRVKLVPTGPDGPFCPNICLTLSLCLSVTLYNCSVGRSDCSRCHTADHKYGCVWCGSAQASCLYSQSCSEPVQHTCPAPVIHTVSGD